MGREIGEINPKPRPNNGKHRRVRVSRLRANGIAEILDRELELVQVGDQSKLGSTRILKGDLHAFAGRGWRLR